MEKREMAGDYEILQAVRLGGKEVLLGYNPKDGCAPYMTSYREVNFLGDYTYLAIFIASALSVLTLRIEPPPLCLMYSGFRTETKIPYSCNAAATGSW